MSIKNNKDDLEDYEHEYDIHSEASNDTKSTNDENSESESLTDLDEEGNILNFYDINRDYDASDDESVMSEINNTFRYNFKNINLIYHLIMIEDEGFEDYINSQFYEDADFYPIYTLYKIYYLLFHYNTEELSQNDMMDKISTIIKYIYDVYSDILDEHIEMILNCNYNLLYRAFMEICQEDDNPYFINSIISSKRFHKDKFVLIIKIYNGIKNLDTLKEIISSDEVDFGNNRCKDYIFNYISENQDELNDEQQEVIAEHISDDFRIFLTEH